MWKPGHSMLLALAALSRKLGNKLIILTRWVRIGCVQKCTLPLLCMFVHNGCAPMPNKVRLTNNAGNPLFAVLWGWNAPVVGRSGMKWHCTCRCSYSVFCLPPLSSRFCMIARDRKEERRLVSWLLLRLAQKKWCLVELHSTTNRCNDAIDS